MDLKRLKREGANKKEELILFLCTFLIPILTYYPLARHLGWQEAPIFFFGERACFFTFTITRYCNGYSITSIRKYQECRFLSMSKYTILLPSKLEHKSLTSCIYPIKLQESLTLTGSNSPLFKWLNSDFLF